MDLYTSALLLGLAYVPMGLGIFISMRIFNIPDITTDGSFTLGAAVTSLLLSTNHSPLVALPLAVTAGMIAGLLTGFIHTRLKIHALLAGILVMTALYSINLAVMGRSNIPLIDVSTIFSFAGLFASEIQNQGMLLVAVSLLLLLFLNWLLRTDFGIAMRATGNSESMVRASGVNTQRMKITGLAISNGLTALSGYLITQYQGFADINMGIGIVISGLAAVMIGDSLVKLSGKNKILYQLTGVVLGTISFRLILAMALSFGLNPNYLKLVTAAIVLLVISITQIKKSREA